MKESMDDAVVVDFELFLATDVGQTALALVKAGVEDAKASEVLMAVYMMGYSAGNIFGTERVCNRMVQVLQPGGRNA